MVPNADIIVAEKDQTQIGFVHFGYDTTGFEMSGDERARKSGTDLKFHLGKSATDPIAGAVQ